MNEYTIVFLQEYDYNSPGFDEAMENRNENACAFELI